jgi:hypothetical protein
MINATFTAWLAEQSPETQAAIEAKWDELQTASNILPGPKAEYARKALLLKYAKASHGYQ